MSKQKNEFKLNGKGQYPMNAYFLTRVYLNGTYRIKCKH